ncbi:RNA-binding protein [Marinomonas sp. CT5]|uniref:RNA recognition motif domain-containing protein n=1 Tax=Marinomonas sp. CT5 TaxID=2066133 RepID=UPI001BAEBACF|nr:RNA-binding protein [Marinomonas sp. CT5]QUX95105.1 RNA-binding protein [Marinomonas sp. CT5]
MKILVRNLARNTTEDELRNLFAVHGTLQSCTLVLDKETGESKGFAFVEMPKVGEAKLAIKALNGLDLDGSKVRVKKAEDTAKKAASDSE